MPKETYKSAYSLVKEAELHLQLAKRCLQNLDPIVNDAISQSSCDLDEIVGQTETNLSATTHLANELKQSIEQLRQQA